MVDQTRPEQVKLNPPRPFTGKRTDLNRFLQDIFVYLFINREHYNNEEKKIGFVLSFLTEGDAAIWKEQFIDKIRKGATDALARGDDPTWGSYDEFLQSFEKSFAPFDAPGDALDAMKNLKMGENIDEHISKFRLLLSQSGLKESAVIADLFQDTLPFGLKRAILTSEKPPKELEEWFTKATQFHNNWRRAQRILGRRTGGEQRTPRIEGQRKFVFPKREKDPNAMDVDRLTVDERAKLMKEGRCFKCRKQGHLSRDCPGERPAEEPKKKWDGKSAAAHIRALIAGLSQEEKDKLEQEAETEGLGF